MRTAGTNPLGNLPFSYIISYRSVSIEDSAAQFVKPYLTVESIAKFADFDSHLDDVSNDWRNRDFFYSAEVNKVK